MKICIVGGGLAGLALAVALSSSSTAGSGSDDDNDSKTNEIYIIEKGNFTSRGATFGLALNGQVALQEICPDLLIKLKEVGILLSTGGYMLPWYRVRDGLLEKARACQDIHILSQHELHSIQESSSSHQQQQEEGGQKLLKIVLDDGTSTATNHTKKELEVNMLIGADGVHSTVRRHLKATPALSSDTLCWRGAINDLPDDLKYILEEFPIAKMIKTNRGWFSIFNFNSSFEGFISWVATSKNLKAETPFDILDGIDDDEDAQVAKRLLEVSTQHELEFKTTLSTIPMISTDEGGDGVGGWGGQGLITLIGDAAHALRPASGLGGSLAFEDAVILARQLKTVSSSMSAGRRQPEENIEEALRNFESIRFTRCKAIVDDQSKLAEASYDKNAQELMEWTPEYKDWLFEGPDADLNPPIDIYVAAGGEQES